MSIAGKKSIHFRKKDLIDQKVPSVNFKTIKFAHEASAGDTIIDILALTTPSVGMPANFVQPNASDLSAARILTNKNAFRLVSSINGYLEFDSYEISSESTITLGYSAAEGEVFVGTLDNVAKTGLQVIDNDPIVITGNLPAGTDEFIVGKPFDYNKYPSQQQGAILVFLDGQLLARNVSNTQSSSGDGDYYEVDVSSTVALSIKINETSTEDRHVMIVSNGLAGAAPSESLLAQIQSQGSQLDAMIPTLAALAGVPESNFQTGPNDVDLSAFGARMTTAEADIVDLENNLAEGGDPANGPVLATSSSEGAVLKNKWQSKVLASDVTTSGTAALSSISFNGLTIGKHYKFFMQIAMTANNANPNIAVYASHNAAQICACRLGAADAGGDPSGLQVAGTEAIFKATAATVTLSGQGLDANGSVNGNGTRQETFTTLEELNNYEDETADFT